MSRRTVEEHAALVAALLAPALEGLGVERVPLGAALGRTTAAALDQLDDTLPNRRAVSLVVTWFGTDLRAGSCQVVPKVETQWKTVRPVDWAVAGFTRGMSQVVSQVDPATLDPTGLSQAAPPTGLVPAFGGTPPEYPGWPE